MAPKQTVIVKNTPYKMVSNSSYHAYSEAERRMLLNGWGSVPRNGNQSVPAAASSDFSDFSQDESVAIPLGTYCWPESVVSNQDPSDSPPDEWSGYAYHRTMMPVPPMPGPLVAAPTESPRRPKPAAETGSRAPKITNTPKYHKCAVSVLPYSRKPLRKPAGISIKTSRYDFANIVELYRPLIQRHEPAFNTRGKTEEGNSLDYLRCPLPIEQLDVCTVWKGLSLQTAEVLFEMQRTFLPSLEDILAAQLEQLDKKERMKCSPFRSALDGDRASIKRIGFSLSQLIDHMLDRIELRNHDETNPPTVDFLMELFYLFFISQDCLVNLETYNYTDTAIKVRLLPGEDPLSDLVPPPVAHLMQKMDYISFSELDLLPREGGELRIVPFYHCGARAKSNKKDTQISYALASHTAWLTWDSKLCGFRGKVPMFSECRGSGGRPANVIDIGRQGPYAVVNLLRIEIHAILTERHSLCPVQLERTVRARVNLKVIPWYAHRSSHIPRTLQCRQSSSVTSGHSTRGHALSDKDFWTEEPLQTKATLSQCPLQNARGNRSPSPAATTLPIGTYMSHAQVPWKSFDSKDYNVTAIFEGHRQYYKADTIPGSPRKDIHEHFGLGPYDNSQDCYNRSRQSIPAYSVTRPTRRRNYGSLGAVKDSCPIEQLHWEDPLEFNDEYFDRFELGEHDRCAQRPSELTSAIDNIFSENVSSDNGDKSCADGEDDNFPPKPAAHQGRNTPSNTPSFPPVPRVICYINRYSPLRNLKESSNNSSITSGSPWNRRAISRTVVSHDDELPTYEHVEYADGPFTDASPDEEEDSEGEVLKSGCNERKVDSGCYLDDGPERPNYCTTPAGSPPQLQDLHTSNARIGVLSVDVVLQEYNRAIGKIKTVQRSGIEQSDAEKPRTTENPRQQGQNTFPTMPANSESVVDYRLQIGSHDGTARRSSPNHQSNGSINRPCSPPSPVDDWQPEEISPSTSRGSSSSLAIRVENDDVDPELRRRQALLWNILTASARIDDDGKGNKIKKRQEKMEQGERWGGLMGAEVTKHRRGPSEETLGMESTGDAEEWSGSGSDVDLGHDELEGQNDDDLDY